MDPELTDGIRVLARLALVADRICTDAGISLVQYRMLFVIAEQPQRAGHLADRLAVSRPTLTAASHSLVDRGLVVREPVAGDGRGVQLRLTPAGATALRQVEEGIIEVLAASVLSEADVLVGSAGFAPAAGLARPGPGSVPPGRERARDPRADRFGVPVDRDHDAARAS